jgi:hypothetical protein
MDSTVFISLPARVGLAACCCRSPLPDPPLPLSAAHVKPTNLCSMIENMGVVPACILRNFGFAAIAVSRRGKKDLSILLPSMTFRGHFHVWPNRARSVVARR